jgi:quercetin 2,3-dioxygenase
MKIHKANNRGGADYGWLKTAYSFSFSNYYNPENIHFGALRVLNDDTVLGGGGFGMHPHDNMEIITIPLKGKLAHKDSMGNGAIVSAGEIQVMSAGTGIYHSEFNASETDAVELFQIWIFPNKRNVNPRYQEVKIDEGKMNNTWLQVVSPNENDEGAWIHQNAWVSLATMKNDTELKYTMKDEANGLFLMSIEGSAEVNGEKINSRDAIEIINTQEIILNTNDTAKFIAIEVPMIF